MGISPGHPAYAMPPAEDDQVRKTRDLQRQQMENVAAVPPAFRTTVQRLSSVDLSLQATQVEIAADKRQPGVPVGLTAVPVATVLDTGAVISAVTLTWGAVADGVDLGPITVDQYEVWAAVGANYARLTATASTSYQATGFTPGAAVSFEVRAQSAGGVFGEMTEPVTVTAAAPPTLAAPTAPTVLSDLGTVTVRWDGKLVPATLAPANLATVYATVSATAGGPFTPVGAQVTRPGEIVVTGLPVGSTQFFKLTAIDTLGRSSASSAPQSVVVSGVDLGNLDADVAAAIAAAKQAGLDGQAAAATAQSAAGTADAKAAQALLDAVSKSDAAKAAAIAAAATDAQTKATAAENAAKTAAAADAAAKVAANGRIIYSTTAPTSAADKVVQNLWIDTSGTPPKNTPNRLIGTTWTVATDKAATDAATAAATADGKAVSAQGTANTAVANAATAQSKADTAFTNAGTAQSAANTAKSTADTAVTYAATAQSKADAASSDALAASGLAASKGKVIYGTVAPTGVDAAATTLWIDTTGGANTPKRWTSGTTWSAVTDKAATDAASAAATANSAASTAQGTANTAVTNAATAQSKADTAFTNAATAQQKAVDAFNNAATADGKAVTAQTTANGKNKIIFATTDATGTTGYTPGDVWFKKSGSLITGQWEFVAGAWALRQLDDAVIGNLNAGTISAGTLNAARIAANSLDAGKIIAGSLTAASGVLADAVITNAKIADLAVNNAKINDLNGNKITARTVAADRLVANSITANEIAATTITGDRLVGGTITGTQINGTAIDGKTITGAVVRTASSGARVELTTTGLKGYDASSVVKTSVGTDGLLTATGANITGTINATSGTISGAMTVTGSLTGGIVQTASSGQRIVMSGSAISAVSPNGKGLSLFAVDATATSSIASLGRAAGDGVGGGITFGDTAVGVGKNAGIAMNDLALGTLYFQNLEETNRGPVGAFKMYATYTAMDNAPGTVGPFAKGDHASVYADPTPAKNGDYVWSGSTWTRGETLGAFTYSGLWSASASTGGAKLSLQSGIVMLSIAFQRSADMPIGSFEAVATLPLGFRPTALKLFPCIVEGSSITGGGLGEVTLNTSGLIQVANLAGAGRRQIFADVAYVPA